MPDLNRSFDWTEEQRHFLHGLDSALKHERGEAEHVRLAERRLDSAKALVEHRRAIFLRNIPDGAGLATAAACPWRAISRHSSNTHGRKWMVYGGAHVSEVATDLVELARIMGEPVEVLHNDTPVQAVPGDTRATILERFQVRLAQERLERKNR